MFRRWHHLFTAYSNSLATAILGISAFYHDSAAALIIDGKIIAAAQEERFTRIKHDASFPAKAVHYVLEEAGLDINELTAIAFYDKPLLKFERLLETYHAFSPAGLASFIAAIPVWIKEKLFIKRNLRRQLGLKAGSKMPILFPEHHLSHAASAYYPSPFEEAAILTIDGVGEWSTTTICKGNNSQITVLRDLYFPHSVGLLYSAFTYYLGFKVNSGEYKLMGLAPYGHAQAQETIEYREKIFASLVDMREDGSILLKMEYFHFATGLTMTNDRKWENLFGIGRRLPEAPIGQAHMNLALAAQLVVEEIVLLLAKTAQQLTGSRNLVMAGGVALNCVANTKIALSGIFDQIWIQPAAGDAGGALGAALAAYHIGYEHTKITNAGSDLMQFSYLGPSFSDKEINKLVNKYQARTHRYEVFEELTAFVSAKISKGKVVGWFQGRMEFGPRALGNRSILGDPRNPAMQKLMNESIKFREGFRPFAPSVLEEDASLYFEMKAASPYMLFVYPLNDVLKLPEPAGYADMNMYERLYHLRSSVPAITHIDYSARVQTVSKTGNPRFWQLIKDFKAITGCSMLINTSFNQRGEPVVCTPDDAFRCFMNTEMDLLVVGDYLFEKENQGSVKVSSSGFAAD